MLTGMPVIKKRKKSMRGKAHSKGSEKNKAIANREAQNIKKHIKKFMKDNPKWSAPLIANYLNDLGVMTEHSTEFKPRRVQNHMKRLGLWG